MSRPCGSISRNKLYPYYMAVSDRYIVITTPAIKSMGVYGTCAYELKLFNSPPINRQMIMKKTTALSSGTSPPDIIFSYFK